MSDGSGKLRYQVLLEEYLATRGWTDPLEVDEEKGSVLLVTGVSISGQNGGRLAIEASDATDLVSVFFYLPTVCKESKFDQMAILFNHIHARMTYGRFQCMPDGYLRWMQKVDFEGSAPTPLSIERIVQPGWNIVEQWADTINAVALTKQTAAEAIEEYDEAQQKAQTDDEGGPTEL
jgi:hypothetical protein